MPDSILGLPLHPLVVHAVVVLLPLAGTGAIALALVPRWRRTYGWLVLAVATAGAGAVPVATSTGEHLQASLPLGGSAAAAVQRHQDFGELVKWAAAPLWVLVLLGVLATRRRRDVVPALLWALAAVAGVACIVLVVLTGHSGASAVWGRG